MSTKEAYEKKLQAQLDEWALEYEKLKVRADKVKAEGQIEYQKELEELRSKQKVAQEKLDEIKAASGDAWEDLKTGLESSWDSLSASLKSAASRFK